MLETPLIQVAGVIDQAEAALLQECGVRYLGFPLRLPVNREDLTEAEAAAIIRSLRPPTRGVLITYLDRAKAITDFCAALGARMVQLHGDISTAQLLPAASRLPTCGRRWPRCGPPVWTSTPVSRMRTGERVGRRCWRS